MVDEDEDEYAPIGEDLFVVSDDPELVSDEPIPDDDVFDSPIDEEEDPPFIQDGPGLFGDDEDEPPAVAETHQTPSAPNAPESELPLALYRRYRPDTFAEVIGQEHVTVPLQRALDNNRVNHAYLFSGPRGCGKTTSARILARCLNCEQGPTSQPCGVCQSCTDLARGGPGSIDVIEIDAASHGGVDDARDLRERAFFAPVHSRYKVYIVDEAHMVTTAGFNALLKLVEEPPPHAKFVFATTEPEKVIGTIRSRTHHYPFRLVPPKVLGDYLAEICEAEQVPVEPAALPLVVRAGAGSVRDSLSVLDQLLGGAGERGVEYAQAAALLGFTPDTLLDDIVDAFAAGDSAAVFQTIDKVIEVGQDPRRFAEDLLRRLRDLVILAAVPQAAETGLLQVSDDQAQRLTTQVAGLGAGELTRAAEVIATGLTDMRGTTAPRLHLELMCARVLLPGADADERGLHARMDRLERRVGMIGDPEAPPANWDDVASSQPAEKAVAKQPATKAAQPAAEPKDAPATTQPPAEKASPAKPAADAEQPKPEPAAAPGPKQADQPAESAAEVAPNNRPRQRPAGTPPGQQGAAPTQPTQAKSTPTKPKQPVGSPTALSAQDLRRLWPEVLEEVKRRRRYSYMMLTQNAQVVDVSDGQLVLGFANRGARENFASSGTQDVLADSIIEVIGVELRIQTIDSTGPSQKAASPKPSKAPKAAPKVASVEDEMAEVSEDDQPVTDAGQAAAGLLTEVLGAEIIDVAENE